MIGGEWWMAAMREVVGCGREKKSMEIEERKGIKIISNLLIKLVN